MSTPTPPPPVATMLVAFLRFHHHHPAAACRPYLHHHRPAAVSTATASDGDVPGGTPQGNNGLAIASLVLSIVGVCCGIGSILGIILGFVALNQIKKTASRVKGSQRRASSSVSSPGVGIIWFFISLATGNGTFYYSRRSHTKRRADRGNPIETLRSTKVP